MDFLLLGPLEVLDAGRRLPLAAGKQRALLADLLLHANRAVPVERLVDDLWGEDVPDTAVKAVQVYVSKLRKTLPEGRLETRGSAYLLEARAGELDLARCEALLRDGRAALGTGDASAAARSLAEAVGLWRGPALAEFDEPFALAERGRLEELHVTCLEERIEADLALGRHAAVVGELETLVTRHPLRERLRSQLMLALYRSGRQAEALAAYQAFRRELDEGLGIEPSQQLRDLERRMLQQDASLEPAPAPIVAPPAPAQPPPPDAPTRQPRAPVGREVELAHLRRLWGEAREGQRRIVFVSGEAGAGKTTLVDAFADGLDGAGGILVASGQCIEHRGTAEAYLPVLEAVSRLAREGGDPVLDALRAHAPTWLVHLPALVSPDELEALQARSLGLTPERMLRELADALDALTASIPVVLLLEDLHWSDPSTLDLLESLARRRDPARLLVIGTFRRADPGSDAHPVRRLAHALRTRNLCSELAVGPLDESALDAFVQRRFPGEHPPELVVALHDRTAGNALFVEKVVDAWGEAGAFARDGDAWRLVRPTDELAAEIPATLRNLIEERLDALDPADRDLLEGASVVGAEFASRLAAAAVARDELAAEERLDALARSGILVERRDSRTWPGGTVTSMFAFTHELCQEVLYERLPAGRRANAHARAGAALEAAWGDDAQEVAAELAWHFVRAGEAPAAVGHLIESAEQALARMAPREALAQLDAALASVEALEPGAKRDRMEVAVLLRRAPTLVVLDGWMSPDAEAAYLRARDLAAALEDEDLQAETLYGLGSLYEVRGEYSRSGALMTSTLGILTRAGSEPRLVDSHELMACSLVHQGASQRALEHADIAASISQRVHARRLSPFGESPGVSSHVWASLANWHLGRLDAALERAERGIAASTDPERSFARAMAQVQAAMVAQLRGEPERAARWAASAIVAAQEHAYRYWEAAAHVVHGWAAAATGSTTAGIDEIRTGLADVRATGARFQEPYFLGLLADACRRAGRLDEGLEAVAAALATCDERAYVFEPELHRIHGELLDAQGDEDGARASLRTALEAARHQGSRSQELRAALSLLRLEAAAGDPGPAARCVASVYGTFDEALDTPDLVEAGLLLDELDVRVPAAAAAPGRPAGPARPPVRYARSGDLEIAYQVTGAGSPDVVLVPGFVSHLEKDWEEPRHAHFLDRLSSFSRLIRFDKRGTGLSDRPGGVPDLETRMDDVRAVMDAAGSSQAVLFGYSEGAPMSILFAATYPERVRALVLYAGFAKRIDPDDDYPWAPTREARAASIATITEEWGFEADMRKMCPSADEAMARWWGERCRAAASPGAVRALMEMNSRIDVRDVLSAIRVPTLVVHRGADPDASIEEARYMAERIPGARLVALEGADHFPAIDPDQILDVVEPFVLESPAAEAAAAQAPVASRRVLATVLMTDLVGSTEHLTREGDVAWAARMEEHDRIVREELARWRGEEVDTAGDSFHALFDGPARAVHCALAVRERLARIGLDVRAGVHTGEIERLDDAVRGIAVHLAARAAQAAGPGDVLVTSTTHDLVEGSGLRFEDRGERVLKGIERPRRLFAVVADARVAA